MQEQVSHIKESASGQAPVTRPDALDAATRRLCDRVRELRQRRKWTLEQLSAGCGVSRSMLSQIERGQANPTLAVACRIAQAFGITIGEMVDAPAMASAIEVIRVDDPAYHYRTDPQCRIRTLSPLNLEKDVEFYEVQLSPGGSLRSAAHFQGAREFFTVHQGTARVISGKDTCRLRKGDSAHYRADVEHIIENTGRSELVGYLVVTYTGG